MLRSREIQRLRHIARTLSRYGFREMLRKPNLPIETDSLSQDSALPADGPRRFRLMLEELGPTFIKLGQVLSSRADLVSAPYLEELQLLQDRCEPVAWDEVEKAVVEGLGAPPSDHFEAFERVPLATASIAQVHEARTRDGERVVVKVQRPGVAQKIRIDLDVLYRFAQLLELVFEEGATVDPVGVIEEFDRGLAEELNFRHEAANAREFARTHAQRPDIEVPRVLTELSSSTVLTMGFVDGVPFHKLPASADRPGIARRLVREAFDQVFQDGLFHADPHPGNLLYLGSGRFGVLDFGLLGRLTRQMQETLVSLALAVSVKDPDSAARTLYRLGQTEERVDIQRLRDDVGDLFDQFLGQRVGDVDSRRLIQALLSLAVRHRIRVPADYAMLGRAAATLEGIIRDLDPTLDAAEIARPYAERLLKDRVAPDSVQGGLYRALLQWDGMSQDLPLQLSQIVSDLASNRFGVRVGGRSVDRIADSVVAASYTVSAAILGGAFIIGSFIGLARVDWTIGGIPLVGLMGAVVGLSVTFWLVVYVALRPRMKKLSLARLLWGRRPPP